MLLRGCHGIATQWRNDIFSARIQVETMRPYIKSKSPLRGDQKPHVEHGAGLPKVLQRQKDEVAATRRALRKAARREGKREIDEAE